MSHSVREVSLDSVLNALTKAAMKKAVSSAAKVDGFDAVDKPTSIRLTRGTLAFYDTLATEMGVSRNSVLQMVLEHMVITAMPER